LEFPPELFEQGMTRREIEKICSEKCPSLTNKIILVTERKLIRQANRSETFLL